MNKIKNTIGMLGLLLTATVLMSLSVHAQLLVNEVEIDPPNDVGDRCQYVELLGTPGGVVPVNTYFISINSDQDNFGFLNAAVNIGGQTIGSNGTLTLLNTVGGNCPNRTYAAGTTIVNYFTGTTLGQNSEGFYVVNSTSALAAGQDIDSNDDGVLNFTVNFIDGFNLINNPQEQYVYGPGPTLNTTFGGDVPDAVTRFGGNITANSAAAFYFGELASSPEETTTYAAPFSANFPNGGMLTPGAVNVPTVVPAGKARADFDGDGRTDLSVFRPMEGNWYVQRSTIGFFAVNWGSSSDTLVPGDYDGDNKTDTAVFRPSNTAGVADFYVLNSNGFTAAFYEWGSTNDIPVVGDYDGDDKTDVAVFRPASGDWYVLKSTGGSTVFNWGQSGDIPLVADLNGDGLTDYTVRRGTVWMASLSGGGTINVDFGLASDEPVQADYDGDSKDDIAVFRPSNGTWYYIASNGGANLAVQWGQTGDIPVPGDYDGDGKSDFAIYRNGQWWLLQSTSGQLVQTFGVAADKPIPNEYLP